MFLNVVANTHLSIPLGITIGLAASFIQSLGLTIQRKSHVLNNELPEHDRKREYRRPLWLMGLGIFVSSNVLGSFIQIASLPVVILAPLGAVSLLWNAFFARFLLGDVFSPWMILGTFLIAGGAILIAIFGIVPEPTRSLEDLLALFRRPTFVAYFSLLGAFVVIALAITHLVEFSLTRRLKAQATPLVTPPRSRSPPIHHSSALTTGVTEEVLTERTPLLDPKAMASKSPSLQSFMHYQTTASTSRTHLWLAISYSSFSGIISGMCLLFAKSGVELLLLTLQGDNQFWRWQAWVLVLGLAVFAVLQLWYLHKALILADPTLVCPSAFCFYNLSSIVNGLVYFDQFALLSTLNLLLVVLGMVILLGGVWVVSVQSGGGGVDVGTWQEGDEEEEVMEALSPEGSTILRDSQFGLDDIVEETSSPITQANHRAQLSTISIPQANIPSMLSRPSPPSPVLSGHDRQRSDSILLSPTSAAAKRRASRLWERDTLGARSTGGGGGGGAAGGASTLGIPGGGFQIGLSPVSPGFAILPKERTKRRRVTSGYGTAGSGASGHGGLHGASVRRRTLSEGDITQALPAEDGAELEEDGGDERRSSRTRQRWRWLTRVFTRR